MLLEVYLKCISLYLIVIECISFNFMKEISYQCAD